MLRPKLRELARHGAELQRCTARDGALRPAFNAVDDDDLQPGASSCTTGLEKARGKREWQHCGSGCKGRMNDSVPYHDDTAEQEREKQSEVKRTEDGSGSL